MLMQRRQFLTTHVHDLPIQDPTVYNLGINLSTAKAFGLVVPREHLVQARQIIE
jgi:hypothetical protein